MNHPTREIHTHSQKASFETELAFWRWDWCGKTHTHFNVSLHFRLAWQLRQSIVRVQEEFQLKSSWPHSTLCGWQLEWSAVVCQDPTMRRRVWIKSRDMYGEHSASRSWMGLIVVRMGWSLFPIPRYTQSNSVSSPRFCGSFIYQDWELKRFRSVGSSHFRASEVYFYFNTPIVESGNDFCSPKKCPNLLSLWANL